MAAKYPAKIPPDEQTGSDRIATGLLLIGGLAAVVGFAFLFSLWWRSRVEDKYEILRIASQEFVNGQPIVAGELAERVVFEPPSRDVDSGGETAVPFRLFNPNNGLRMDDPIKVREEAEKVRRWSSLRDFLVGVGRVVKANEEEDSRQRRRWLADAIPYLESSERAGFPPGRVAQGYRILGEALFQVGRYDEAVDALKLALEQDPSRRRDLLPIVAESQLNAMAPLTENSLQTIDRFMADAALLPRQRWAGALIRLRSMIELDMWDQVDESIRRELEVEPSSSLELQNEAESHRDQLLLLRSVADVSRAIKRHGRYGSTTKDSAQVGRAAYSDLNGAIQQLNELQREASPKLAAQARLWSARAHLVLGRIEEALTLLTVVRQQRPFGAESIVGGLEEIESLARLGRGLEMLQTARYMMRELGDARGFDASLITFDEFQRRIIDALEQLRQKGQYQLAIDVARSLPPVIDVIEALTQEAIGFREWAASAVDSGTGRSGRLDRSVAIEARGRYRAAGDAFAQAAELQFNSDEYVSTLWEAIDAYQQGRHFSQSIRLLKPYLQYESRGRLPRGLVAYGRALLAEDEPDAAIEALITCIIEYPRDPLRYDARLLAAIAHAEKGHLENAKELLQDNLHDGELTPQSPAWRDSLLTLGELLYERGYRNHLVAVQSPDSVRLQLMRENQPILEEATRRLDEAVDRYWPIPRAEAAAYRSAKARVMSSQGPRLESQLPEILDAARRTLRNQSDQKLQAALAGFDRLRRHLAQHEEAEQLPDDELAILRNCLLAEADVLRELNRLEDAASAYRTVELRYMNEPPALEAILGRVACARQLGRHAEADLLIRQATVVLQRIPSDLDDQFAEMTRYDRSGWENLLSWMNQRIVAGGV